jgi:hypothetical protein
MMSTKVKPAIDEKGELRASLHTVKWPYFSCAGEGCTVNEDCARWDRIHKEECSALQQESYIN